MELLVYSVFWVLCIFGFLWSLFGGMGTLLVFVGALLIGLATNFDRIHPILLFFLAACVILGELLEQVLVFVGAKVFGASKKAAFASVVGGFFGILLGILTGFGLFIFPFLGIFLGAFIIEMLDHRDMVRSLKSGAGSLVGRTGAALAKLCITLMMIWLVASQIQTGG